MLLESKNSGLTYKITVFVGLFFGVTCMSWSQSSDEMLSNRYERSDNESPRVYNNPDSRNSVDFTKVPLKKALQMISNQAGLILSYRSGLFLSSKEVSLDLKNLNVEKTLENILADTKLKYKITNTRHLIVYKEEKLGHIKGDVLGATSSDPLQGAKVLLVKCKHITGLGIKNAIVKKSTFVAKTGRYNLYNVEAGTYRLIVIDKGHKKIYKKVQIEDNTTTVENFRLKFPRK